MPIYDVGFETCFMGFGFLFDQDFDDMDETLSNVPIGFKSGKYSEATSKDQIIRHELRNHTTWTVC